MKKIKLNAFSDGGHGWLCVKRKMLIDLGILDQITGCSFQRGESVYLEEDQDLTTFVKAFEAKNCKPGETWKDYIEMVTKCSDRSAVRGYARFRINPPPTLEPGKKFRLYDGEFTALYLQGKNWIAEKTTGGRYKITARQLDEITEAV